MMSNVVKLVWTRPVIVEKMADTREERIARNEYAAWRQHEELELDLWREQARIGPFRINEYSSLRWVERVQPKRRAG